MRTPARRPAAFTLLEILLAVAILMVISSTIYQFTNTTMRVANVATRVDAREQAFGGLRRLLAAQFAALPGSESPALVGATNDGSTGRQDNLQMICPAGIPVLTPDARGLYQVAFELREMPKGSGHHTLVMDREPWSDSAEERSGNGNAFRLPAVSAGGVRTSGADGGLGTRPAGWVRLLDGVRTLQFDYFDPRLNNWVDKWNDPMMTPSLVRVRLAMENGGEPYEFVEKVPGGGVPHLPANLTVGGFPNQNGGVFIPGGGFTPNSGGGFTPNGSRPTSGRGATPPTAPPPGAPPTLPAGLSPPTAAPPMFDPTKPFIAPDTGTGLPPGFQ